MKKLTKYGRVASATYGSCGHCFNGTSYLKIRTTSYHNYDWLPDAVVAQATQTWTIPQGASYPWIQTQRCDNSTTADYYSLGEMPDEYSGRTSGTVRITTCDGTGY